MLVAGLGNLLMRDDGLGVHAVRALEADPPPGARLLEVGTAVLDALDDLEESEMIIALDAMQAGGTPGTIYRQDPARAPARPVGSSHEIGLFDALAMIEEDQRPSVIALGVEPACIDYGMELSEPVRAALPERLRIGRETIAAVHGERRR